MNVLFLIRSLENGGAERQLTQLANELARRGHGVSIGVFYSGGVYERSLDPEIELIDLRRGSHWSSPIFAIKLLRLVRARRPDVIHGYLSAGNLAGTLAQLAWPEAKLVWGVRDSSTKVTNYGRTTRFAARLMSLLADRAQLMIFNSRSGYEYWLEWGCAAANSICIPNGINVEEFEPDHEDGARYRRQCGIPDGVPLVGMVARLDPVKDHPGFLRAAAQVADAVPQARFLCLGAGPAAYRTRLQTLAADLGISERVIWPEPTCDMRAVYNALTVFCLASHAEGFPNVVAEAMACAKECVVTDVGDAALVVGAAGIVVPREDPGALADAILTALARSAEPSAAARQRIVETFSVGALGSRTEESLVRALAGGVEARPYGLIPSLGQSNQANKS